MRLKNMADASGSRTLSPIAREEILAGLPDRVRVPRSLSDDEIIREVELALLYHDLRVVLSRLRPRKSSKKDIRALATHCEKAAAGIDKLGAVQLALLAHHFDAKIDIVRQLITAQYALGTLAKLINGATDAKFDTALPHGQKKLAAGGLLEDLESLWSRTFGERPPLHVADGVGSGKALPFFRRVAQEIEKPPSPLAIISFVNKLIRERQLVEAAFQS